MRRRLRTKSKTAAPFLRRNLPRNWRRDATTPNSAEETTTTMTTDDQGDQIGGQHSSSRRLTESPLQTAASQGHQDEQPSPGFLTTSETISTSQSFESGDGKKRKNENQFLHISKRKRGRPKKSKSTDGEDVVFPHCLFIKDGVHETSATDFFVELDRTIQQKEKLVSDILRGDSQHPKDINDSLNNADFYSLPEDDIDREVGGSESSRNQSTHSVEKTTDLNSQLEKTTIVQSEAFNQSFHSSMASGESSKPPFTKTFLIWNFIDSMDVFQELSQQPHFELLKFSDEYLREGSAVGCMLSFAKLVRIVHNLRLSNSLEVLIRNLEAFDDFVRHGFNVEPIRARIEDLITIKKDDQASEEETALWEAQNCDLENEFAQFDSRRAKIDFLISELQEINNSITTSQERCKTEMMERKKKILDRKNAHSLADQNFTQLATLSFRDTHAPQIRSMQDLGPLTSKDDLDCMVDADTNINSQLKKVAIGNSLTIERLSVCTKKILLVLDLNGLLVDIIFTSGHDHHIEPHMKVRGNSIFKRPFCDEFLDFCFNAFDVGVWSSRKRENLEPIIDCILGDKKRDLLFCWDQSHCTNTGFSIYENPQKPLFFKELKKLWDNVDPKLPEDGKYSESNTLLIDDSPYKAFCNPLHTAIFPHPYCFQDKNDSSLGPGGDIRVYLDKLVMTNDVQLYVKEHPFGQEAVTCSSPSGRYYTEICKKL